MHSTNASVNMYWANGDVNADEHAMCEQTLKWS